MKNVLAGLGSGHLDCYAWTDMVSERAGQKCVAEALLKHFSSDSKALDPDSFSKILDLGKTHYGPLDQGPLDQGPDLRQCGDLEAVQGSFPSELLLACLMILLGKSGQTRRELALL